MVLWLRRGLLIVEKFVVVVFFFFLLQQKKETRTKRYNKDYVRRPDCLVGVKYVVYVHDNLHV